MKKLPTTPFGSFLGLIVVLALSTSLLFARPGSSPWPEIERSRGRTATALALEAYPDPETIEAVLEASRQVYRHFVFSDTGPRMPPPPEHSAVLQAHPGLCEAMVTVLRALLPVTLRIDGLNMVAPFPKPPSASEYGHNYLLRGHSITTIETEGGRSP